MKGASHKEKLPEYRPVEKRKSLQSVRRDTQVKQLDKGLLIISMALLDYCPSKSGVGRHLSTLQPDWLFWLQLDILPTSRAWRPRLA